jgi:MFS family permease
MDALGMVFLEEVSNTSDIVGRKPILYGSIITFLIGSALCGAAQCFPSTGSC